MRFKRFLRIFSAACVLGLLAVAIPLTPVMAAGAITYITPSVAPGGTVLISGSGFSGTASYIVVSWAGGDTTATQGGGVFSTSFVVPVTTASGPYTVTVYDIPNSTTAYATFTVAIPVSFTLGAANGYVGDVVTVTGSGFTPGVVSFYWDGAVASFGSLTASSAGALSGTITIPAAARGTHSISTPGVTARSFIVNSKIVLVPISGGVGDTVSVTGSGFAANAYGYVYFDFDRNGVYSPADTPFLQAVTTSATGTFTLTLTATDTTLSPGDYDYDLEITLSGGALTTMAKGVFRLWDIYSDAATS